jgi:hypothetical protein
MKNFPTTKKIQNVTAEEMKEIEEQQNLSQNSVQYNSDKMDITNGEIDKTQHAFFEPSNLLINEGDEPELTFTRRK